MKKNPLKYILFVFAVIIGFSILSTLGAISNYVKADQVQLEQDHIGFIRLEGPFMDALPKLDEIRKLKKNKGFKALLIRMDTPGGAVGAAQELYIEIEKLKKENIPVVVSFGNVSASGGVYASGAADFIFALPGTVTGSIGVITQFPQVKELMEKIGVDMKTLKSGKFKDVGNPFRKMSKEEEMAIHSLIGDSYEQFVQSLLKYRKIEEDTLRNWADGRIFTGAQAYKIGLVDSLGSFTDAKAYIKKLAQLPDSTQVIEIPTEKDWVEKVLDAPKSMLSQTMNQWDHGVYYLWR